MSNMFTTPRDIAAENRENDKNLIHRTRMGVVWQVVFYIATAISILALVTLIFNILDSAFGYVAIVNTVEPEVLVEQMRPGSDVELADLEREELITLINDNVRSGLVRAINAEQPLTDRSQQDLAEIVVDRVVIPRVEESWHLWESITQREEIFRFAEEEIPGSWIQFRSWVNLEMIGADLSNIPENAGLRLPILGSLMVIMITILFAFPVGVGAALYLEEFAPDNRLNRFIQVNIYNLSGVPSIIYGLLGLAVFVRILEPVTSGFIFGAIEDHSSANGRTILSGGLTLGLLILPIIIINAQEAIRAVPQSLRDSAFGLGATRWQTVWYHVLPASMDRILTGTIIAVSRALGETAPLVVIGASAFLTTNPSSIFDKFTTLPIMIYRWTAYPQAEFRNLAAAAILVLLVVLLSLNATAIIMRDRIATKRRMGR
jgi:phosphate transport system permease protein